MREGLSLDTRGCHALSHPSVNTPFSTFECLPSNGNLNVGNDDRIYSKCRNLGIRKLGGCRNSSVFLTGKETSSSISFSPLWVFRARKRWLQRAEGWASTECPQQAPRKPGLSPTWELQAFLLHHEGCSRYNRYVEMIRLHGKVSPAMTERSLLTVSPWTVLAYQCVLQARLFQQTHGITLPVIMDDPHPRGNGAENTGDGFLEIHSYISPQTQFRKTTK